MKKTQAEKIRDWKRKQGDPIRIGEDGEDPAIALVKQMLGGTILPTQRAFLCDPSRYKAYKGPAGCGKTSIALAAGLSRALWEPGSIGVVAQHDYNHLLSSTYSTFQQIINRLPAGIVIGRDKSPPMTLEINPIGGGEPSLIRWIGLKENLGGYEFNWCVLDEADGIEERAAKLVDGRMRYKPASGIRNYCMMAAFNPPDKNHWLYTACTGLDAKDHRVQSPWLKLYEPMPNENTFLEANYYDNLRKTYTKDMIQRLVDGEWGSTFEGQPVYREFRNEVHTQDGLRTRFDPYRPLLRFWDFGYNAPYCCFAQTDWHGRLLVMAELQGSKVEATPFIQAVLAETDRLFPDLEDVRDYGDPAVAQKKDTGQTLSLLCKAGITMRYRNTHIDPGVKQVRELLDRNLNGEPALQFDRQGCPILISALRGGYHMDEKGLKPVKDNYYDHSADAFRYGIVNVFGLNALQQAGYVPATLEYRKELDVK